MNRFSVVPNFVLIITPQPIILKQKEKRAPKIGINVMKLTRIRPNVTARSGEVLLFPNALQRLSPKKKNRTTRPKMLMIRPMIRSERRIGIPIRTKESKIEMMISPVNIMMLKMPVLKIDQNDFLIWEDAREI